MLTKLLPPRFHQAAYRRKFVANSDENLFMGTFDSFAAAQASAPEGTGNGYDNVEGAKALYSHQIYFYDYPALFWVGKSLGEGMRTIFDLGGHVGIKYYAFRRLLHYPPELRWCVCDVAGVVQAGRELETSRGTGGQLSFTTEMGDVSGCDLFYASGSLQYLPQRLGEILKGLPVLPRRIVLNTTAMHPERTIYTHNSIGFAICPYRIHHYDELLATLTSAGYKRRDGWRNEGKSIEVPFVEGGDKAYYAGGCFDLH